MPDHALTRLDETPDARPRSRVDSANEAGRPVATEAGSLLEPTVGGKRLVALSDDESCTCLEVGDAVILRARRAREGFSRIGFGDCRGQVLAARA